MQLLRLRKNIAWLGMPGQRRKQIWKRPLGTKRCVGLFLKKDLEDILLDLITNGNVGRMSESPRLKKH